jgi:hypothetical protein
VPADDTLLEPDLLDANSGPRFPGAPSIFCAEDMRHDVSGQLAARPDF